MENNRGFSEKNTSSNTVLSSEPCEPLVAELENDPSAFDEESDEDEDEEENQKPKVDNTKLFFGTILRHFKVVL